MYETIEYFKLLRQYGIHADATGPFSSDFRRFSTVFCVENSPSNLPPRSRAHPAPQICFDWPTRTLSLRPWLVFQIVIIIIIIILVS